MTDPLSFNSAVAMFSQLHRIGAESKYVRKELESMDQEYPTLLQKSLPIIEAKIEKLHDKRQELIDAAVASCDHPLEAIRELPYNANPMFTAKPWLVCTKCGYAEQGWYCGYRRLKHAEFENPPKITPSEFHRIALVRKHQPIED